MFGKLFGGYTFPYNLGEPYRNAWGAWTHYRGTAKDDATAVSIFRVSAKDKNDPKLVSARNGVKRLKLLRHPNMLVFKDTAEVDEKGETVVYLVTEAVTPLVEMLDQLELPGNQRNEYIAMGLYHIANAVSFLNNDCKLIHGNVCMAAVVVTDTLDWKLHGTDLVSEHQWHGDLPLTSCTWLVAAQYKPAELAKGDWSQLRENPPWAVDAWGLGCLMQEACNGRLLTRTEDLRDTAAIPEKVLQYYQRLLASVPSRRLNPVQLLESAVFKTKLVESVSFLENLAVKDVMEKDTFFKRLPAAVPSLPQPVAERKLLPLLSGALEYGGAPPVALSTMLQIGKSLSEEDYQRRVVPTLSKLFASNDRTIRRSLLENIDSYGKALPASTVEEQIYPNLNTGFTDSNALLRELTLKSMLVLVPKLSQRTINNSLLKSLAKLQVDEEPSIRANTTILLGKLADHLSEATCKRVLLNAFSKRALKDPFPPARIAGLRAMCATVKYYSAEEAAVQVLPAAAPLAADAVPDVRAAALALLDTFSQHLKEAHRKALASAPPPADAAPAGTTEMASGGGGNVHASGASWGTWAMSNLGIGGSSGNLVAAGAAPADAPAKPSSGSAPAAAAVAPAASSAHDGWDNGDLQLEEQEEQEDAAERAARQRLSRLASSSGRPAARKVAPAVVEGWGGDDGGLVDGSSGGDAAAGLRVPQSDGLDGLMADMAQRSASAPSARQAGVRPRAAGRGAGRTGAAARRTTGRGGGMKLGATKVTGAVPKLGDDWGAEDF